MLLSNRLTFCITSLIVLMAFGFVFAITPVMAHAPGANVAPHSHPLNELIPATDRNNDGDTADPGEAELAAHNGHPVPNLSTDDDATTVTDDKDGNRIKIVEVDDDTDTADVNENTVSRTFTLLVDFGQTTVVGQSDLMAIEMDIAADPVVETADSIPDLTFTTLLLDGDGRPISTSTIDAASITTARVEDSTTQIMVTIVLPAAAVPDGMGTTADGTAADEDDAFDEITLRIRVNPTGDTATDGVFSLATRPGFDVVPGGRMMMRSNLLELTLVDDLGMDPTPDPVLQSPIGASMVEDEAGEVTATFTFTFDPANPSFTLGDITVGNGIPTAFSSNDDNTVWTLVADAIDDAAAVTVAVGDETASSTAPTVVTPTGIVSIRVIPPTAPNADGDLEFIITSSLDLTPDLTINDFDINTQEVNALASGDLEKDTGTLPDGIAERWTLTVTPKSGINSVLVEVRAGASTYQFVAADETTSTLTTPGAEGRYTPETVKPTIGEPTAVNLDDSMLAATPGDIDSVDGGTITVSASDAVDGDLTSQIGITTNPDTSEVLVSGGKITAVNGASFTLIPNIGATTVTVTVKAGAVADNAGNMNDAKSKEFTVGPIFTIAKDAILVISKTAGMTHQYLSDEPRLPINVQPPTPAPDIQTDIWHNMPDLEVLFSLKPSGTNQSFGGTLNLVEADGQAELPQTRDGGDNQKNSVRISEVMWASDLSKRGGLDDDEAAEQWIEITNATGSAVTVFLYARTGRDSSINSDSGAEDRIGNAYNGSPGSAPWAVRENDDGTANNSKGQNGNSHDGVDFISMHRTYEGAHNRGYKNGTSAGHWHESDREYLTLGATGPSGKLYHYIGSPGRPHSFNLPKPDRVVGVTNVPSSPFIINEVANRNNANAAYEWIEIKNVATTRQNLKHYRISKVTATGTDTLLIDIPNKDYWVDPGDVILLLATDPRDNDRHPIAVGFNVDISDPTDQVDGLGLVEPTSNRKDEVPRQMVVAFQNGGLPDDGTFILLLRKPHGNNNRAGLGEADVGLIVDIAGHHEGLTKNNYPATNPTNLNNTTLWPLVNYNGDMRPNRGHGDWNHRRHNRFEANRVRYRQHQITKALPGKDGASVNRGGTGFTHKNRGVDHYAFRDADYTGLGYKRTARIAGYNNGTPGYDGNSVKNTGVVKGNATSATVTISEIMYSTGPDPDTPILPQWIELYNSSPTDAVNLRNWKLRFEMLNADGTPMDSLLTLDFNKGRVKTILPQQTVLIVAGNARQANSDSNAGGDVFADNRVFNVYREYGNADNKFGANTRYMFFNPKRFHMALLDKDNKVVDAAGNLDGDARTSDTGTWDFPLGVAADGNRTSIIRIYDDADGLGGAPGVVREGVNTEESHVMPVFGTGDGKKTDNAYADSEWGWIPAVNTKREFKITIKSTWFGVEDDYGTPNNRPGMVLPVELSFFRPTLQDGVVTVRWTTESELDNAGFNILRSETRDGEYTQVNAEMIQGAGTTGERTTYSWVDPTAKPGVVYYYQIEDVSFAGERQALAITKLKGLISAENKLTTTWSELKASQ